jgi:hypothetical protein
VGEIHSLGKNGGYSFNASRLFLFPQNEFPPKQNLSGGRNSEFWKTAA